MKTTNALKTIGEALQHATEESIYISGWRRYRAALVALNGIARSLESHRVTTETLLGIEIPESEGPLEFALCVMRAVHDLLVERDQLRAELQRIQAAVPLFPAPKDPVAYIYELIAELCTLKVNTRQAAEQAEQLPL